MDAVPTLPPYGIVTQEAAQCIAAASLRYEVPELLLHAIVNKERGSPGKCVKNKNGSYDCGLAQINTVWADYFKKFGVPYEYIKNDTCTNLQASAYILKKNYLLKGNDWFKSVVAYNIGPNNWSQERYAIGYRYAHEVITTWWQLHSYVAAQAAMQSIPAEN